MHVGSSLDLKYLEVEILALRYLDVKLLFCENEDMAKTEDRDHVDAFLDSIHPVLPDLDLEVEGIVDRISGLARRLQRTMDETLAEFGLDTAENKVLSILAQGGEPFRSTPGRLAARMELSSGAMTNRLDRMEAAGLIRRLPDPNDRRGTLIEPTDAGHAAWDKTAGTQARREAVIAEALTLAEREQLHDLLRKLMRAFPDKQKKHFPGSTESE